MIKVENISMNFGKKQVLKDINFEIKKGTKFAIVGDSGCGKSTLARIITNLVHPTDGKIILQGKEVNSLSRLEKAKHIQMVFQHPISSFDPKKKLKAQLEEVIKINSLSVDIAKYLENFGLSENLLDRYTFQISGGEAQRLSIIRSIILSPEVLILDEPTSMLDVSTQAEVFHYLDKYQQRSRATLILISHDIELVSRFCDDIVIINDGEIIEMDTVQNVLHSPKCEYTRTLIENFNFFYE